MGVAAAAAATQEAGDDGDVHRAVVPQEAPPHQQQEQQRQDPPTLIKIKLQYRIVFFLLTLQLSTFCFIFQILNSISEHIKTFQNNNNCCGDDDNVSSSSKLVPNTLITSTILGSVLYVVVGFFYDISNRIYTN